MEIISIEWPAVFTTISVISGDFYVHYFSVFWQKKELEGQQPEKSSIAVDDVQKTSRPKPVRNFSQRRPFADGVTDRSATISHDVLAGVRKRFPWNFQIIQSDPF